MEHDAFFDQPSGGDSEGLVVNGRYAIKHPDTGKPTTWQRASNFGSPLSDRFAVNRWQMREFVRGLHMREDLIELIRTATEISNAQADQWIAAALETAATSAKANRGTAIHEVLRAYDNDQPHSARYEHIVTGYGAELRRQRLTPVGTEFTILNVPLGAAGKADRVYREADGSYVLGDVKTGRLDYAVHDFAVQCAVYASARHLVDEDGTPRPMPWVIRQDYAVLVHVDPVTGESSTYRLDLLLGRRAANLAVQVRAWRNTKDVALPYVPPDAATIEAMRAVERVVEMDPPPTGVMGAAERVAAGGVIHDDPAREWSAAQLESGEAQERTLSAAERAVSDVRARSTALGYLPDVPLTAEHVAAVNAGIGPGQTVSWSTATPQEAASAVPQEAALGELRIRPDGVEVHWTGHEWAAGLNEVQVTNLRMPGDGPRAGMPLTGEGTAGINVDRWAGAGATARANSTAGINVPPSQQPGAGTSPFDDQHPDSDHPGPRGAERMTEPLDYDQQAEVSTLAKLPKAELQRMLKALGGTDLAHHRSWLADEIVRRKNAGGSQPVTVGAPATGTASAPAAEQTPHTLSLIGTAASVADLSRLREKIVAVGGDQAWTDEMTAAARARTAVLDHESRASVLSRVDSAGSSQELAALWAELTLSGTAPSHWTDEYQSRATERLNAINAAQQSAPPVNPFARQ